MSTAARIDELRKKFEENPRRYFAPLANEFRKAGDLVQAIALCREHLPKQPGHMSGYIVFGQALYESGALEEARDVFEQALDLDPENLIALRHLGDIARASGDESGARRWWGRVLDADPRNDDIAAQLAALATATPPLSVPVVEPPDYASARAHETPAVPMTHIGFGVSPTPDSVMRSIEVSTPPWQTSDRTPIDLEAIEADAFDFPEPPQSYADADLGEKEPLCESVTIDDVADSDEASFEEGLIAANWPDTTELVARVMTPRVVTPRFVTPLDSSTVEETVSAFGREPGDPMPFALEHPDTIESMVDEAVDAMDAVDAVVVERTTESGQADESAVGEELPWLSTSDHTTSPDDAEADADVEPGLEAIAFALAEDARAAGDDAPMLVATMDDAPTMGKAESFADVARELVAESAASHDAHDEVEDGSSLGVFAESPEPRESLESDAPTFVTETMGELLISQGFVARAVEVYEELVRRRPYDPVLSSRLGELRDMLSPVADVDAPNAAETSSAVDDAFSAELAESFSGEPEESFSSEFEDTFSTAIEETFAADRANADHDAMRPTPSYGTPALAMPYLTPRPTPYAQPAVAEAFLPHRTAREWFAAIAARRVPRRTPPQSAPVTESSPEGLALLFGNETSVHDDAAAQALADAFAPVSAHELASGSVLDFEFARSTPTFSPSVASTATPPHSAFPAPAFPAPAFPAPAFPAPAIGASRTPSGGSNTDFSFDRFFPDPATRSAPPAAASIMPDVPVTDDLAQFSQWLKGLGNS